MKTTLLLLLTLLWALNSSSQTIAYQYICPVPGSKLINPEQVIALKTGAAFEPGSLSQASIALYSDRRGLLESAPYLSPDQRILFIKAGQDFLPGETITVSISKGLLTAAGNPVKDTAFHFEISHTRAPREFPETIEPSYIPTGNEGENRSVLYGENNLPSDYPAPTYVFTSEGASPGYTFFTPTVRLTPQWQKYITIWDNYGTPVYYRKVDKTVTDFKVLDDGTLTYAVNGLQNPELDCYYLMDSNYDVYDSVRAGNGYYIDNHDILKLENGHYLILVYDQQVVNMSLIVPGGDPAALVTGLVIQEVDNNENVFFQWRSWDHFEITDATWDIDLTSHWIDYVHANALDLDSDGNILVSSRHLDEITKIDYNTGEIIWRFGKNAENNQFNFVNDPLGFSHQHDIRKLANGNYTVYDNGNLHIPPGSRAVEYHLNTETMEATLVWHYEHDPSIYAPLTGGNQRLPNNNRLIGWGGTSPIALTEVNAANQVVFELYLPDSVTGYRARKYNWQTTVFSTQPAIDFGNFEGYSSPKKYLLQVTNNYQQSIQITSTYNRESEFWLSNLLPLTLPPGASAHLQVFFQPTTTGDFSDILTLNYDNQGNTVRIARQLSLSGRWESTLPSAVFSPENGAQNVDPNGTATLAFNEPMRKIFQQELQDSDVPNLFNFKMTNLYGANVPYHGTVSEDKTLITIIPDEILDENQQYFIELKPNLLEDYQGNVMDYPEFCFFTTGDLVDIYAPEGLPQISIYPNPVGDLLRIESHSTLIKTVEIFSPAGCLLMKNECDAFQAEINTSLLPSGLLLVRVTDQGGFRRTFHVSHF